MSTTPLRSSVSLTEPDRLAVRISNLQTRQKALDAEQLDIDRERREIQRLQREAFADEPRRADDAPPARQRPAEHAENDGVVIDGVSDPSGFAKAALAAAAKARGERAQ
jgi:hypothetical protein